MNSTSLRQLLHQLGASGQTGALHIDGTPGGVLYLIAGHITHAESPVCPGVGERLVASGRLSAATWTAAYDEGHAEHRVGRIWCGTATSVRTNWPAGWSRRSATPPTRCCRVTTRRSGSCPASGTGSGVITQVELGALIHETAKRLRTVPAPRADGPAGTCRGPGDDTRGGRGATAGRTTAR